MTPRARELRRASRQAWLAWRERMDDPDLTAACRRAQREEIAYLTAEEGRDLRVVSIGLACVAIAPFWAALGLPALMYQTLCWGGVVGALFAWTRCVNRRVEHELLVERGEREVPRG